MLAVGLVLASLVASAPAGATPPPGGSGPVAGDLTGRWEIRLRGLPPGYPGRLVVRLVQDRTRIRGAVLAPPGRAFVTGKMLGRFYMVELRPLVVRGATSSLHLELSLDPSSRQGLGTVHGRLEGPKGGAASTGSLEMRRLGAPPAGATGPLP